MLDLMRAASDVARRLQNAGHEAFLAGGCVRDHILGRPPMDVDIATSARPEQVQAMFHRTVGVGRQFGVILVLAGEFQFDVATFRSDGAYGDGRRPDEVSFTTAEEDVKRRDFTINGLLMEPESREIIDFVGGRDDLDRGLIRTIGDAEERFAEDHLRLLRAVRFAARLDFEIESNTAAAIVGLADRVATPSAERISSELQKMLTENDGARALRLLDELQLLPVLLPSVSDKRELKLDDRLTPVDSVYDNALDRTVVMLSEQGARSDDPALAWALLLEDLRDEPPRRAADRACAVMRELRASNEIMEKVRTLVSSRDRLLFASRVSQARLALVAAHPLCDLLHRYHAIESHGARDTMARPAALPAGALPKPLLSGHDLMQLGVPRGRALGRFMKRLRFLQLNGTIANEDEARRYVEDRVAFRN